MNMRILSLVPFFVLLSYTASSQNPMDSLALSACDCLSKLDIKSFSGNDLEMQLGLCIVQAVADNEDLLYDAMGEDFILDETTGEKLGQQIGFKMAALCPDVFSLLLEEELEEREEEEETTESSTLVEGSLLGKIKKVENTQFVSFIVTDENGKRQKLYWTTYFPNSDQYIDNYEDLIGSDILFNYYEDEYFDPRIGEYTTIKIITGMVAN